MWVLVDVSLGWVIHFESYRSAIVYRNEVGRGVVLLECMPVTGDILDQARANFDTGCHD